MVYVCDNCGARFSRATKQDHCPDCGKRLIHSANQVEQHEYASQIAELIRDHYADSSRYPNMVMTEISVLNCFAFKLPATAVQIDSDMVVELLVEYGENAADQDDLTANVWARPENGMTNAFLMTVHLPAKQDEPLHEQMNRVFSALSGNRTFSTALRGFIQEQLNQNS